MLNFNFSEKGLALVSQPHFVYDFSRTKFLMLYSINCITIACLTGSDVIKFQINLTN